MEKKDLRRMSANADAVLTEKEATAYLRCSSVTLWRERRRGNIAYRRVASRIVYMRSDLDEYLDRNKRPAVGVDDK